MAKECLRPSHAVRWPCKLQSLPNDHLVCALTGFPASLREDVNMFVHRRIIEAVPFFG